MCAAPLVLAFSRHISKTALKRSNETGVWLSGLCGGTAAHQLFIADNTNDVVRSFDVRFARLDARDVFRCAVDEHLHDVAYCAESLTLFVATTGSRDISVRSFARTNLNGDWSVCHRMQRELEGNGKIFLRVLRDGTLIFGLTNTNEVHLCRVLPNRSIQHCAPLRLPAKHIGFDAQLNGNEKRLAAAFQDKSVALFRLDTEVAVLLSHVPIHYHTAKIILFCGETVVVGVGSMNEVQEAESFTTIGGRLQRDRQLLPRDDRLGISRWCFMDKTLYAWDWKSKDLLVYNSI